MIGIIEYENGRFFVSCEGYAPDLVHPGHVYEIIGNIYEDTKPQQKTLSDKIDAEDPPFGKDDYEKLLKMRIIKFRGKDISQDIWYEGSLYQDEMVSSIMFQKDGTDYNMIVDRETVGQFTGRKDMNENEIFEGDILVIRHQHYGYEYSWDKINNKPIPREVKWGLVGWDMPINSFWWEIVSTIYIDNIKLKKERRQFTNKAYQDLQEVLWDMVIEDCLQYAYDTVNKKNIREHFMDKYIISKK